MAAETSTAVADRDSENTRAGETAAAERTIKMTVDGKDIAIVLYDTPAAKALYEALPLTLNFSDFNGTEKIAYPQCLADEGGTGRYGSRGGRPVLL